MKVQKSTSRAHKMVQVDLFADGIFDETGPDVARVMPDGSAWIDPKSGHETSFRWQDLNVQTPMLPRKQSSEL